MNLQVQQASTLPYNYVLNSWTSTLSCTGKEAVKSSDLIAHIRCKSNPQVRQKQPQRERTKSWCNPYHLWWLRLFSTEILENTDFFFHLSSCWIETTASGGKLNYNYSIIWMCKRLDKYWESHLIATVSVRPYSTIFYLLCLWFERLKKLNIFPVQDPVLHLSLGIPGILSKIWYQA